MHYFGILKSQQIDVDRVKCIERRTHRQTDRQTVAKITVENGISGCMEKWMEENCLEFPSRSDSSSFPELIKPNLPVCLAYPLFFLSFHSYFFATKRGFSEEERGGGRENFYPSSSLAIQIFFCYFSSKEVFLGFFFLLRLFFSSDLQGDLLRNAKGLAWPHWAGSGGGCMDMA